jgi:hypothetical protein
MQNMSAKYYARKHVKNTYTVQNKWQNMQNNMGISIFKTICSNMQLKYPKHIHNMALKIPYAEYALPNLLMLWHPLGDLDLAAQRARHSHVHREQWQLSTPLLAGEKCWYKCGHTLLLRGGRRGFDPSQR